MSEAVPIVGFDEMKQDILKIEVRIPHADRRDCNMNVYEFAKTMGIPKIKYLGRLNSFRFYIENDLRYGEETGVPTVIVEKRHNIDFKIGNSDQTFAVFDLFHDDIRDIEKYVVSTGRANAFAFRWLDVFENKFDFSKIFDTLDFSDEAKEIGFEMDGEKMFIACYSTSPFEDTESFKSMINDIEDIAILGSGIHSKWRYHNHWSMGPFEEKDKEWFIIALGRLLELTKR